MPFCSIDRAIASRRRESSSSTLNYFTNGSKEKMLNCLTVASRSVEVEEGGILKQIPTALRRSNRFFFFFDKCALIRRIIKREQLIFSHFILWKKCFINLYYIFCAAAVRCLCAKNKEPFLRKLHNSIKEKCFNLFPRFLLCSRRERTRWKFQCKRQQ